MTTPDRFGKFSGVDYNPSDSQELEVSRQAQPVRPARGLQNQRNRARAINMARGAGNALDRSARGVAPAGRGSQLIGAAARGAMSAPDGRVRAAGAVVNRVVQAHDVAAANGVDIPGRAKDFAMNVAKRIQERPSREQGFFSKLTQRFGNRANSVPEAGENVGQYGERMMTAERDERTAAQAQVRELEAGSNGDTLDDLSFDGDFDEDTAGRQLELDGDFDGDAPGFTGTSSAHRGDIVKRYEGQLGTRGMDEFIGKSRELGEAIVLEEDGKEPGVIDGEVVDVREHTDIAPVNTDIVLADVEDDFDTIDAEYDLEDTAGTSFEIVDGAGVDGRTREHGATAREHAEARLAEEKTKVQRDAMFDEFKDNEFGSQDWSRRFQENQRVLREQHAASEAAAGMRAAGQEMPQSQMSKEDQIEAMREASQSLQRDAARKWASDDANHNPFSKENLGKSTEEARKQMRGSHDRFAGMMMMSAIAPLRNGVDAENLAGVAGSLAIMWALSPKFRQYTDTLVDKVQKGSETDAEHKAANEKKGFLRKSLDERKRSAKRAAKHIFGQKSEAKRMQESGPEHAPYQVDSAATQLVNLSDNAYVAMREPKANVEVILRKYGKMSEELEQDWEKDGLDTQDVYERARWIVGQQSLDDPTVAGRYIDTHIGNVQMGDNEVRRVNGPNGWTNEPHWAGNWVAGENQDVTIGRSAKFFIPRAPQTLQDHAASASSAMTNVMRTCMNGSMDDPAHFREFTNTMAAMTSQKDEFGDTIDTFDVAGSSNPAARGVQTMQSLRAAMRADGLTPKEMHIVLSTGMSMATQNIAQQYPDQMAAYEARLQQIDGAGQTIDTARQQRSAKLLADPGVTFRDANAATKATPEHHIGTGLADHYAHAREEAAQKEAAALRQDEQDAEKRPMTTVDAAQHGSKSPMEDGHGPQFEQDEPTEESAVEKRFGTPGEGAGSRQRQQDSDMARKASADRRAQQDRQRRNEQHRRASRTAAQQQHETDNSPEL